MARIVIATAGNLTIILLLENFKLHRFTLTSYPLSSVAYLRLLYLGDDFVLLEVKENRSPAHNYQTLF